MRLDEPPAAVPGAPRLAAPAIDHGGELDLPGGPDAVLMLHGLTGSTFELHPLAGRLRDAGFRVLAPVMAGHGATARELRGVPWTEWVAKAARDLGRLRGARRTFLVGASMGGLVACALAHRCRAQVDGLVLLAPALELTLPGRLAGFLGRLGPLRRWIVNKGGFDVGDGEMRRRNRGLTHVPFGAVTELTALSRHVRRVLPEISAPALIFMGARDRTVEPRGVRRLAEALGSGPAEVRVLPRSAHLLGIDVDRDACAEEVLRFLRALATVDASDPGPAAPRSAPADAARPAPASTPASRADPSPGRE